MISTLPRLAAALGRHLLHHVSILVLIFTFGSGSALAAPDAQGEFEQALKEYFPGSYTLYTALSGDAQDQVFKEYKKNAGDPGIARFSKVIARILELTVEEDQSARSRHKRHSS